MARSSTKTKAPAAPAGAPPAIELRPIGTLKGYERNARKHPPEQVAQIAASMQEFGWTIPVLVREDDTIVAGHGRVMAIETLWDRDMDVTFPGGETVPRGYVPVLVARGWSEDQFRAYVLADNQLAANAEWDEALLKIEVRDLNMSGFDLGLIGFDAGALGDLLAVPEEPAAPDQFPSYDEDIPTEHKCPRCSYTWSGKPA